jgi:hypothetical protein
MSLKLKGFGTESKGKVITLGLLILGLGVAVYVNVLAPSGDAPPAATPSAARVAATDPGIAGGVLRAPETRPRPPLRPGLQSLRPEFKLGLRENPSDPTAIDPTLRLDLLARLQSVSMAGGARNLFQFGAAPLPPTPEPKIIPARAAAPGAAGPGSAPVAPPKPPPPPIPLKFYGYTAPAPSGAKRVFFLDGDEIIVAAEGQLIKNRYKVVGIGVNSVVVEDTQYQNRQTLPLEDQAG